MGGGCHNNYCFPTSLVYVLLQSHPYFSFNFGLNCFVSFSIIIIMIKFSISEKATYLLIAGTNFTVFALRVFGIY